MLLLDAWASLDRPDLRAAEEAVRRWVLAAGLARPWSDGGVVVLCGAPSHVTIPAVEALVRWDPQWFAARELAEYRRRVATAWPQVKITDVDSYGLPDVPLLGSELTLTAMVHLGGLRPDEVTVQAVLGRVDGGAHAMGA